MREMMMRTASIAFLLMMVIVGDRACAQDVRIFRIGTGGVAGTYFPIGGLLADAISNPPGARSCESGGSCGVDGLIAIAQSSDGSIANIEGIVSGVLDSGLAQSDIAYSAFRGALEGKPEASNLRLIASLYVESMHVLVTAESGIGKMADLRGKRISLDDAGSGTRVNARLVLDSYGIAESDIEASYVKPVQAGRLIRAGDLDGFFIVAGYPTPSIVELSGERAVKLLEIDGAEREALLEAHPFFSRDRIPGDTYEGVEEVQTIGVVAQWLTSAELDEELVYEITRSLWNGNTRRLLDNGHAKGREITLHTALSGAGVPLHPGAERYYREAGILTD
ncbi:MAG: TAXI family TRAP transporter solute-binding subunit [Geminicoccaceae bacterium]